MSACIAVRWFLDGAEADCSVCGRGPCPRSFNLPIRGEHVMAGTRPPEYARMIEAGASTRGLTGVFEVGSRRIGDTLHVMHAGHPA